MKKSILALIIAAVMMLTVCSAFVFAANEAPDAAALLAAPSADTSEVTEPTAETAETAEGSLKSVKAIVSAVLVAVVATAGAIGMAISIVKSINGIARQPEAEGKIRTTLMLGLVFIETTIIYALIVAILVIFVL